jgi:hypothetical protein
MESVYHIVAIRVNETSWAHVWRLHFRYFGMGYDGQRQTSTIPILHDNFGEKKVKFNLKTSRITQMQLYKCIHIP